MKPGYAATNKVSPPNLPGFVVRKQLLRKLEQRGHYGVTWISGQAGSGKTTLAAGYLAGGNLPCLWYKLDESDEDPSTFFYYLGLAARKAFPRKRFNLPPLTPDYLQNVSTFSRRYFEKLCLRLTPPFFLVFDDYQKVPPAAPFHETFRDGISVIPSELHVIVMSRTEPPPEFAGMLANNRMRLIGRGDLNLSLSEAGRVAEMTSGKRLSRKLIGEIYRKTRGWAAGLILMAKLLDPDADMPDDLEALTPEAIFDYFAGELFNGMEEHLKAFLLSVAFVSKMTVSTSRVLAGRADASRILTYLERNHLFTERYFSRVPVYRFHPMFRQFLLVRARDTLSPDEIAALRSRAVECLMAAEDYDEVVDLLCEGGETGRLIALIKQEALNLTGQGRNLTLAKWIGRLSDDILENEPWMLYWLGTSGLYLKPAWSRGRFERAFLLFDDANDHAGVCLAWCGIISSIIYEWNDFTALDQWIDWMEKYLQTVDPFPGPEIRADISVHMMSALLFRRPHHSDMSQWVEQALSQSRIFGDRRLRIEAADWAVTYYCWVGNFARAEVIKTETDRLLECGVNYTPGVLHSKWLEISSCIFYGIPDRATLEDVSESLQIVEQTGLKFWEHMFLLNGVFVALRIGDLAGAGEFLGKLEPILVPGHRHGHGVFYHCAALYRLLQGDLNQALQNELTAVEVTVETGYVFPVVVCRYGLAMILIEKGEYDRAEEELFSGLSLARRAGSTILEFMCLAGKAALSMARGREEKGLKHLRETMELGRRHGFHSMVWWWQPEMMTRLCERALREEIETDYVRRLIRALGLAPPQNARDLGTWPWGIKIHAFDGFEILVDDEPLRACGKAHKRPIELLKALIACGPREVGMEKIMDALWPETDGDLAHSAFSTNLNRLRKILSHKDAILLREGKVLLNPERCWADTHAFEGCLDQAESHWESGRRREAATLYERAVYLYKGPFLAEEPACHWAVGYGERLALRYIKAILSLGSFLEAEDKLEEAAELYERGLRVDPLEETLYQRLMVCCSRLGRYAGVIRVYRSCRECLERELGVSPSAETEGLLKKINYIRNK